MIEINKIKRLNGTQKVLEACRKKYKKLFKENLELRKKICEVIKS